MPSAPASRGNGIVSVLVTVGTLLGGVYGFQYVQAYKEKQKYKVGLLVRTTDELQELLQQTKAELARHDAAASAGTAGGRVVPAPGTR